LRRLFSCKCSVKTTPEILFRQSLSQDGRYVEADLKQLLPKVQRFISLGGTGPETGAGHMAECQLQGGADTAWFCIIVNDAAARLPCRLKRGRFVQRLLRRFFGVIGYWASHSVQVRRTQVGHPRGTGWMTCCREKNIEGRDPLGPGAKIKAGR